ncbi:MAG: DUF2179 domain-containing protein [Methanocellales archaeon]|nr:DUF2179 domain-containing protein [Methanocellales archaeon]MDD3421545.1 DUF2179 domain-containing protein [Methanocellales archaeon]MDD4898064.1 DUF2179 domain-containing protein [Methanocellales archaeon]MDD5447459.1 DUF2179 domain-containing protein [Methanocellales archaeon]
MDNFLFLNSETYALVILPLFIFLARILDVSIGTIRIIFISKGFRYIAPIVGFFEITIWLFAMVQIFQHLTNIIYYVAYASGFAMGIFVGICIEDKLSIGTEVVRIITQKNASKLVETLKSEGYGITRSYAEGVDGQQVSIIDMIIDRHDLPDVVEIIKKYDPRAFYSIEDVRVVSERIFPHKKQWYKGYQAGLFRYHRKGK